MAGELLRAVTERQDATARAFDKLTEEMDLLAKESFFRWHGDHVYRFKYERVSPLFVRVELWRDDKPVANAWVMYLTGPGHDDFAWLYDVVEGWPDVESLGFDEIVSVIAGWLLLKIDAEERLGDKDKLRRFQEILDGAEGKHDRETGA